MYTSDGDGIDHINVYSKGKTKLGRELSNFSAIGFIHPIYGNFSSMESFYYWCKTGKKHNNLRDYYGYSAKALGKSFEVIEYPSFKNDIISGIKYKLWQNKELLNDLTASILPLTHYYSYGENNPKIIRLTQHDYIIDEIARIREIMKTIGNGSIRNI